MKRVVAMKNNKLIVVLGMHRGGTSAITRGLEVLGVKLGDNLHPAGFDNPTGFWEDRDVLSINEELLGHLGSAYDRLGLVDWDMQNDPTIKSIRLKAVEFLREKCDENALWGFKDPRTARLLSFWQSVFEQVGCDVGYVIATRNPISIIESLRKRNGFEPEKTLYLWLEHLLPAISRTKGSKRVVVDYDQILKNTGAELLRVARALGLPDPEPSALAAYESEFLQEGLRHTFFKTRDLYRYPRVPAQVITGYDCLVKLAKDNVALDSPEVEQVFDTLSRELVALSPALHFMARQEQQMMTISQAVAERDGQLASLNQAVAERDEQLVSLSHTVTITERDGQLASLNQAVAGRDEQMAEQRTKIKELSKEKEILIEQRREKELIISSQNAKIEEMSEIQNILEKAIYKRDEEIDELQTKIEELISVQGAKIEEMSEIQNILEKAIYKRDKERDELQTKIEELSGQNKRLIEQISQKDQHLNEILNSIRWRLVSKLNLLLGKILSKRIINNISLTIIYIENNGLKSFYIKLNKYILNKIKLNYNKLKLKNNKTYKFNLPLLEYKDIIVKEDATVSVVIPAKNGGDDLKRLLMMLNNQKGIKELEIIVVDSGSSDETVYWAKKYGAKVVNILPEEFTHSYARNVGAENSSDKKYLLIMVQDALPTSEFWIYEMIDFLEKNNIVAVSCGEFMKRDTDLFYAISTWYHYQKFLGIGDSYSIFEYPKKIDYDNLRRNASLSDISCLIKKDIFIKYKYRYNYAEDLDLGLRLIKDNYKIAINNSIKVIHCHNRPVYYYLKRSFVDTINLKYLFKDYLNIEIDITEFILDIIFTYDIINKEILKLKKIKNKLNQIEMKYILLKLINTNYNLNYPNEIDIENNIYLDEDLNKMISNIYLYYIKIKKENYYNNGFLVLSMIEKINIISEYIENTYEVIDRTIIDEIISCIYKAFASIFGAYFVICQATNTAEKEILNNIKSTLLKGV